MALHLQRTILRDRTGVGVEVAQVEVVDRHLHRKVLHDLDRRELVVGIDRGKRPARDVVLQTEAVGTELHLARILLRRFLERDALRNHLRLDDLHRPAVLYAPVHARGGEILHLVRIGFVDDVTRRHVGAHRSREGGEQHGSGEPERP